jgi:hypothetical protein
VETIMHSKLLNQIDLARKWQMSERTLESWRWRKIGPRWIRIGGRIRYKLEDVEAYETAHAHEIPTPR